MILIRGEPERPPNIQDDGKQFYMQVPSSCIIRTVHIMVKGHQHSAHIGCPNGGVTVQ